MCLRFQFFTHKRVWVLHCLKKSRIRYTLVLTADSLLLPPPGAAKAGRNSSNNKRHPPSPLGYASDIAKPYQCHGMTSSALACPNVSSLHNRNAELT